MLNIIWSDDAVEDVLENIGYLEKHWTKKKSTHSLRKLMQF